MKVNGRNSDGSTAVLETNRRLGLLAGNVSWYMEFQTFECPERDIFEPLLLRLFQLKHVLLGCSNPTVQLCYI